MDETTDSARNFEDNSDADTEDEEPCSIYETVISDPHEVAEDANGWIMKEKILFNVSQQIIAIENADRTKVGKFERRSVDLNKYKRSEFLPLNIMLRGHEEAEPKTSRTSKFETQCFSGTQLLNVLHDAEAADAQGVTQEFETSFHDVDDYKTINNETCRKSDSNCFREIATEDTIGNEIKIIDNLKEPDKDCMDEDPTLFEDSTQLLDECMKVETNVEKLGTVDECRSTSPVFDIKSPNRSFNPSPLVVELETFERFEKTAFPIVERAPDNETAQCLINSQIVGKELSFRIGCVPSLHVESPSTSKVQTNEDTISENTTNNKTEETKNTKLTPKDEILFSSDEEEEYLHSKVQDLPLTIASEAAFYDQPHMLDKTMYVGFQTASNKSIQVCKNSFYKAKSVMDDIENEIDDNKPSLSELVRVFDDASNTDVDAKPHGGIESTGNDDGDIVLQTQILKTNVSQQPPLILGFKTASNKNINLSSLALETAQKMFKDIDNDDKTNQITRDNLDIMINNLNEKMIEDIKNKVSNNISGEYNEITKEFENNELFNEYVDSDKAPSEVIPFITLKANASQIHSQHVENYDFDEEFRETPIFKSKSNMNVSHNVDLGFKTASHKEIKISDQAMAKTKNIFSDIESIEFPMEGTDHTDASKPNRRKRKRSDSDDDITEVEEFFLTEFDKLPDIKEHAKLKVEPDKETDVCTDNKNIFKDIFENVEAYSGKPVTSFQGFKTASNKCIQISTTAIEKSKNILQDVIAYAEVNSENSNINVTNPHSPSIHSEKGQENNINISKEATAKHSYKTYWHDTLSQDTGEFVGFQTANQKPVKISSEALLKSKAIFKDIDKEFTELTEEPTEEKPLQVEFKGFKTASNKPVAISKEALEKSTNIFKDIDNVKTSVKDYVTDQETVKGFKMANSKDIELYKDALVRSKKIFQDIDDVPIIDSAVPKFQGFQTASHKKVKISEEAFTKSKMFFEDLRTEDDIEDLKFQGSQIFQTASNKPIVITEDSLAKTKNIFQNLENELLTISKTKTREASSKISNCVSTKSFVGFKTASNKEVKISEHALTKSRQIFEECDRIDNIDTFDKPPQKAESKSFKGFQTASNKEVKISEHALAKSRQVFDECDRIDNMDTFEKKAESKVFKGFQTASNKEVKISEHALAKSRQVFEECDRTDDIDTFGKVPQKAESKAFKGFQTASNKEVKISEHALAKSRQIFQECDRIDNDEINIKAESNVFKGFQTASNKEVKMSEKALEETRKIFQDVDTDNNLHEYESDLQNTQQKDCKRGSFKTGNDTNVKVSDELFSNLDEHKEDSIQDPNTKGAVNIDTLINTQVLENFDESMHTEDFKENTAVKSKRSGSPILFCRPAKRRKFETPYQKSSNNTKVVEKSETACDISSKSDNKYVFEENYKKHKMYTLKDVTQIEKDSTNDVPKTDHYILNFNYDNLLSFEFFGKRNDIAGDADKVSVEDIKSYFLRLVNVKFVPNGWLDNHIKLILWKLISYEIKFPKTMTPTCTVRNVLEQLKYRYDKELYNAERPILRKIMEKDDVASKTMILCVVAMYENGVSVIRPSTNQPIELLLTDGWYCIRANADRKMARLACSGRIAVGTKLAMTGAELVGCEQGVSPWEPNSARLKLSANAVRRAAWHGKLGLRRGAVRGRLRGAEPGGRLAGLRAAVARVYPRLYVEKFADGSTVTRSERLEHTHQSRHEGDRQAILEKLYEEAEREMSDQDSPDSEMLESGKDTFETGSQIARVMKRSKDPMEFRSHLTDSQRSLLQDHTSRQREKILHDIQQRVEKKIELRGLNVNRNVVSLLKARVVDVEDKGEDVVVTKGMLSIWKPNDEVLDIVKEGSWIEVTNVVPTSVRYSEIQLSAGRQSVFKQISCKESEKLSPYFSALKRTCYTIKHLSTNPAMTTDYNEVDTVGMVFLIEPSMKDFDPTKQQFQNAYLSDADKNMISVNFWGGLKKFGFENVLDTGQIVACTNLQKRAGNTRKNVPQYRVTEFSYFTKTPKNEEARRVMEDLSRKFIFIDKPRFCEDSVSLKNNFAAVKLHGNTENVSPYQFPVIDISLKKNRVFIDSPLAQKNTVDDFNLTGLDFDSSFKQNDARQDLSPKTLLRKRQVREKIAKLKMYGEPPPLSPLQMINRSKLAGSSFKSPLAASSVAIPSNNTTIPVNSVASHNEELPNEMKTEDVISNEDQCSPVLLNRTYVKKIVNPVRLNFSSNEDGKDNDQFGEDFECSPPLSLD